jgi:hypothetical protein
MEMQRFLTMKAAYQVAGITIHEDHILLKRCGATWSLIEHQVRAHEIARDVLRKVMCLELGTDIRTGRMLGVIENISGDVHSPLHTLTFCYHVAFYTPVLMLYPKGTPIICSVYRENVVFEWVPLKQFEQLALLPARLLEQFMSLLTRQCMVAEVAYV